LIGVASLVGGVLGVYLRNMVDTDERFSRSAFIGALGALLMAVGIGYMFAEPQTPGDPPALGVGLSSAMLTYCVFTPATFKAFRIRGSRTVVLTTIPSATGEWSPAAWEPPWERWSYDPDHHRPFSSGQPGAAAGDTVSVGSEHVLLGERPGLPLPVRIAGHHSCDSPCVLSRVRDTLATEKR